MASAEAGFRFLVYHVRLYSLEHLTVLTTVLTHPSAFPFHEADQFLTMITEFNIDCYHYATSIFDLSVEAVKIMV